MNRMEIHQKFQSTKRCETNRVFRFERFTIFFFRLFIYLFIFFTVSLEARSAALLHVGGGGRDNKGDVS